MKKTNPLESRLTLNCYVITAPSRHKQELMSGWMKGVAISGDRHIITRGNEDGDLDPEKDFAMIWGAPNSSNPHRTIAFNSFLKRGGNQNNIFYFDSNVLKQLERDMAFYRFPSYSIHSHESKFIFDSENIDKKLNYIYENTNIKLHDWKTDGKNIIIYMNRGDGGWSHQGVDVYKWLKDTCIEIRKYSDRPIKVKDHPGRTPNKRKLDEVLNWLYLNIKDFFYHHRETKKLGDWSDHQIKNAHAAVILTSTAGGVPLTKGIPVFVTHDNAYIKPWSAGELKNIETPNLDVDREEFMRYYASSHWSMEEIERGDLWKVLREQRGFGND